MRNQIPHQDRLVPNTWLGVCGILLNHLLKSGDHRCVRIYLSRYDCRQQEAARSGACAFIFARKNEPSRRAAVHGWSATFFTKSVRLDLIGIAINPSMVLVIFPKSLASANSCALGPSRYGTPLVLAASISRRKNSAADELVPCSVAASNHRICSSELVCSKEVTRARRAGSDH